MVATVLVSVALAIVTVPGVTAAPNEDCHTDGDPVQYFTIDCALDHAEPGDTLVLHKGAFPFDGHDGQAPTVDVADVTICSGPPADGQSVVTIEPGCDSAAEPAVVDTSGVATTLLTVTKPGVTVEDVVLRWSLQRQDVTQDPLKTLTSIDQTATGTILGVTVQADGFELSDSAVEMKTGACPSCPGSVVPAIAVHAAPGSADGVIRDNRIAVPQDADDATVGGWRGIVVSDRAPGYTVAGNDVTGWSGNAIEVAADGAEVTANDVHDVGGTGVSVDGDGATVRGNTVARAAAGIEIVSDDAVVASNTVEATVRVGIEVEDSANVAVLGNTVSDAGTDGIRAVNSPNLVLDDLGNEAQTKDDNHVRETARYGVYLQDLPAEAPPVVEDLAVLFPGRAGLVLEDAGGSSQANPAVVTDANLMPGVVAPATGLWIRGSSHVDVEESVFATHPVSVGEKTVHPHPGLGVTVSASPGVPSGELATGPEDVVFRKNTFRLNELDATEDADADDPASTVTFRVTSDVQGRTIDARYNDWCVDTWSETTTRVHSEGVNRILLGPIWNPSSGFCEA